MKTKILLILIGLIMFLQSCAPTQVAKITSVSSSDQKIAYDGTIISQKKHFVSLSPYTELEVAKDKTLFMIVVQNYGEEPINIGYNNITVIFKENSGNRAKWIKVQQFDNFLKDVKLECKIKELKYLKSALWKTQAAAAAGSSSVDSDSMEDITRRLKSIRLKSQLLQEGLVDYDLSQQIIMPNDSYTGLVVCDTTDMDSETEGDFQVTVAFDGEQHRFTFNRSPYK